MTDRHDPLTVWFWATDLVTTHTRGLPAVQPQRQLGISYETAWALRHTLRRVSEGLPLPAPPSSLLVPQRFYGIQP